VPAKQPMKTSSGDEKSPAANNAAPAAKGITYADAGVDISRAEKSKQRIKFIAQRTFTKNVLSEIGGFGGLFKLDTTKYTEPVLVSSADGVGTKLKVAIDMHMHQTIGADLVNHCVNDIAVQGATPLFFLDYFATGKLDPEIAVKVIEGLGDACRHNGCALIGGETAEMPGFYEDGEYDLAGFIVGVVDKSKIITGAHVKVGDILLGLPSTGLHTNGYSLARKLLFDVAKYHPEQYVNEIKGKVGQELMKTHKSYWALVKKFIEADVVSAMAHITGGGISDNLPRVLPKGTAACVELGSWPVLPIFSHMQQIGNVPEDDMMRTFNMGIGMIVVVPADKFKKAVQIVERAGEKAYNIGRIIKGERKVQYQ
jgi:phosphoribosylformylglycinamidine cyclo-ligase